MLKFAIGFSLITVAWAVPALAEAEDILNRIEQNLREDHHDRAQQRAQAWQAKIAAEKAEAAAPDLSQFGTLVEEAPKPRRRLQMPRSLSCTTIDVTDYVRTTDVFKIHCPRALT